MDIAWDGWQIQFNLLLGGTSVPPMAVEKEII
jgi:hypothetical protein